MNKVPFVTKEQVEEMVKTYPTPFHLYDERGIRENVKALKEAFSWNPGFKEYFAVKATPNPFLMQILRELSLIHILDTIFSSILKYRKPFVLPRIYYD